MSENNIKFDSWVSGDYSGATDGVDIRCTETVFESILKHSPVYSEEYKGLLRRVIYEQVLNYPDVKEEIEQPLDLRKALRLLDRGNRIKRRVKTETKSLSSGLQQNGQLMGSVLSFPILCIINLVAYWLSMEQYLGKKLQFQDLPVLINGDDILFPSNVDHYSIWKDMIKSVGFSLSIGKNYIHKDLFTINSIMFHESNNKVTRYKFFNVGLLTGKAKVTGRDNIQDKPIWDWYREVIDGASNKVRAHKRFIHYFRADIDYLTYEGKQNLFINRWYGGCGFPLDPEVAKYTCITTEQRRRAFLFKSVILKAVKKGQDPSKYILRIVPTKGNLSHACVDIGVQDHLRFIPKTQPLNVNQSLETKRLYNLPLLSQLHSNNSKLLTFRKSANLKYPKGQIRPKMTYRNLFDMPFTLVSESELPLSYQLAGYDEDEARFFDPIIEEPTKKSVTNRQGWYEIDFNTGHILHYDKEYFTKEDLMKPIVRRR